MNVVDVLNTEVGQSQFRTPGENPTWKSELANLNKKETTDKLNEQEKKRKKS